MLCIGCDVGLVDVVIFDCYFTIICVFYSSMFFFVYFKLFLNSFFVFCQICLILAEATAIGIRLSHASRMNLYSWRTAQ